MYAFHIPVQMTLCCRNCLVRANRHIHVYDTVLLKQKKRTVLDITGFFFHMSTQVKAYSCGKRNPLYQIRTNSFVSIIMYLTCTISVVEKIYGMAYILHF